MTASYPSLPGLICFKPLVRRRSYLSCTGIVHPFSLSTLQHGSSSSCSLFARVCLSSQEIFQFELLWVGQLPTHMNPGDSHEISPPFGQKVEIKDSSSRSGFMAILRLFYLTCCSITFRQMALSTVSILVATMGKDKDLRTFPNLQKMR